MTKRTNQSGFTLLEIMIVVSIIVILLGLAISKIGNPTAFAKTTAVRADVQAIGTQLPQALGNRPEPSVAGRRDFEEE